jgi:hypothetical protein
MFTRVVGLDAARESRTKKQQQKDYNKDVGNAASQAKQRIRDEQFQTEQLSSQAKKDIISLASKASSNIIAAFSGVETQARDTLTALSGLTANFSTNLATYNNKIEAETLAYEQSLNSKYSQSADAAAGFEMGLAILTTSLLDHASAMKTSVEKASSTAVKVINDSAADAKTSMSTTIKTLDSFAESASKHMVDTVVQLNEHAVKADSGVMQIEGAIDSMSTDLIRSDKVYRQNLSTAIRMSNQAAQNYASSALGKIVSDNPELLLHDNDLKRDEAVAKRNKRLKTNFALRVAALALGLSTPRYAGTIANLAVDAFSLQQELNADPVLTPAKGSSSLLSGATPQTTVHIVNGSEAGSGTTKPPTSNPAANAQILELQQASETWDQVGRASAITEIISSSLSRWIGFDYIAL